MKRRFFLQSLSSFLMPAIIPLMVFSIIVTLVTFRFTRQEVDSSNTVALNQSKSSLELLFSAANRFGIDIAASPSLPLTMKALLQSNGISSDHYLNYKNVQNIFRAQNSANPNVSSMYLFIDNPSGRFFTGNGSIYSVSSFYDIQWYDTYLQNKTVTDGYYEIRSAQSGFVAGVYASYLTLYYNLFFPGRTTAQGVIVVNFRMDNVRSLLDSLSDGQSAFLITANDGEVLCAGGNPDMVTQASVGLSSPSLLKRCMVSSVDSSVFAWQYNLLTPYAYAYRIPRTITFLTLIFLLAALLLAFLLSYFSSRRLHRSLQRIMEILEQGQNGEDSAPIPPNAPRNSYDYIIQNLLEVFMKQDYLKIQLSEKRYRLEVMELLALQSQINPHFLYNTLQAIYLKALSFTGKPNQVNDMLEHLMVILRYSLSNPTNLTSLEEDIRCTRSYVYLEQQQYGQQLVVCWHVDDPPQAVEVPRLLFQPLVENCIRHGMRGDGQPLQIDISIQAANGRIHLEVKDNGLGLSSAECRDVQSKLRQAICSDFVATEHIGLFNTAKRLHLNYADRCNMTFDSQQGVGTRVSIDILYEE